MGSFTCYRLRDTLGGAAPADLDDFIEEEERPRIYGPQNMGDFIAKLYVSQNAPHNPPWEGFIRSGFEAIDDMPLVTSTGAAVVLALQPENLHFAFTFGTLGRFLLKQDAWERGYGLRTALNLIYPRDDSGSSGKLVAVDAKRRSGNVMRSRRQASKATSFEAFDVDKVRDLVGGATGTPCDRKWGRRITGGDALHFDLDTQFGELGKLCRSLQEAHDRDDYTDKFGWIDRIHPIHDPILLQQVEQHLAGRLAEGDITDLDLATPEIVDWSAITGFRYHFEARKGFWHPVLRIQDYLSGLAHAGGWPEAPDELDAAFLRRRHVLAVDGDNRPVYKWPVWRCLSGGFEFNCATYIIDEGDIFSISQDYLSELNESIAAVPLRTDIPWPSTTPSMSEDEFNKKATDSISAALLMDKKLVSAASQTTPIELCDILTAAGDLIHVKRHFGSSDLSHLFSQGFVSARLIQEDKAFRKAADEKIASLTKDPSFRFFETSSLRTEDFEIVYVIVAPWKGRTLAQALPFFSKINLERTVQELANKGYQVSLSPVDTG
jgi:uncharacterized protein (TIGR04141 family)